ncbi:conserved hypothetical protein [Ricinus communis]|uniref:Uncharacterized protein n=1 Tax=Ricinus communis TaxID=3988 RepID=B9SJH5_RICCO|nr:conserved hypothetical protein [Ricinus communis]
MALSKALMVLFLTILLMMSSHQVLPAERTEFPESSSKLGRKLAQATPSPPMATYETFPGGAGGCYPPDCN